MPAAAHAVGPRYPISPESVPASSDTPGNPGIPGTSSSSNRVPCEPAAAEALLSETLPSHRRRGAPFPPAARHTSPDRSHRCRRSAGSGGPAEVLGRDGVEKLAELLDLVFLLVRDGHARLVQDLLAGEDLRAGAQRQRDGVGRP